MANGPRDRDMLIALLLVLGVNLVVIVALVAAVVLHQRSVRRQAGAFRGAIRVEAGDIAGLGTGWRRGYGRWVRDVLVWTKAPLFLRSHHLAFDELLEERYAATGEVKRLGDRPAVVRLVSDGNTIDVMAETSQRDLLLGAFARVTNARPAEPPGVGEAPARPPTTR